MEHEYIYEFKTQPTYGQKRWEDTPCHCPFTCTPYEAERYAGFLSAVLNVEVRYNEQGSSQGHYVMHPDTLRRYFNHKKEGETK